MRGKVIELMYVFFFSWIDVILCLLVSVFSSAIASLLAPELAACAISAGAPPRSRL